MAYAVIKKYKEGDFQLQVADPETGCAQNIQGEKVVALLESAGTAIHVRAETPQNNPNNWTVRGAMVGTWDPKKSELTLGLAADGKAIKTGADVVKREVYAIDGVLFAAFASVFQATLRDAEAASKIANTSKKLAVKPAGFDL